MNTLGLVNVLNNDGNVLIDMAQMADNHIQNAAIHNALAEWNETDDPFSPETTQRLIGKLKGEMPSLIAWLSEGNYPKSSLVPELLAYVKMPHPLQVYKNLDLDITIEDSEKGPAFDVKLSYAGNAEHFKYAHLPVETDKTSVVLSIIDAYDGLRPTTDPHHPVYAEAVETNYSKLTNLIGEDGIDSIRDFHEGVEIGKYFSDMEFDLKDLDPSAKHILECLGSLEKPVQKAMDNFARVTTFRNLAEKNLLREATLFTSGVLEEKNGRLIVPQGYRPGMSREEYQAWHPSARGNTAISVDTAISAKQLGRLEAIAASQKPQQIVMDVLFLDPGDHLDGMKLSDGHAIVIGKCPKCGRDLYATKNQFRCAGVHFKKTGEKDGKAVFSQDGTCDFSIYRFVGPKDKPKKLTDKNGREIAEKGKTSLIKGIKKKSGDGTYDAYLTLNRETWSLDMKFPEFKGKKHKG